MAAGFKALGYTAGAASSDADFRNSRRVILGSSNASLLCGSSVVQDEGNACRGQCNSRCSIYPDGRQSRDQGRAVKFSLQLGDEGGVGIEVLHRRTLGMAND